jgi:hypothetical protein
MTALPRPTRVAGRTRPPALRRAWPSATGRLMLNMFAVMAQFEREIMLERQREGRGDVQRPQVYGVGEAADAVRLLREGKRVAPHRQAVGDRTRKCLPRAPGTRVNCRCRRFGSASVSRRLWWPPLCHSPPC